MRRGFTLLEVILAVLVLQLGVLGVAGLLELTSRTLTRAELVESAVTRAEGVLDSLRGVRSVEAGSRPFPGGVVVWWSSGPELTLRALAADSTTLFEVVGITPAP